MGVGARRLDDWALLGGQEAIDDVSTADVIIALNDDGAVDLKTGDECEVFVFESAGVVLFDCCDRIKRAWESTHTDEDHLGHAAAGFWMYYWFAPDFSTIRQLALSGRIKEMKEAATDYITADFGKKRGPTLNELNE